MTLFASKAPWIMRLLMADFGIYTLDAAAILGNLGHECDGFRKMQEVKPLIPGSRGGYGWAQWTGPRRRGFEAYCARNNLDPSSDKANYGWLFVELRGTERGAIAAVKAAHGLRAKVEAFERAFERAGVKHYDNRMVWANRAVDAWQENPNPSLPDWARPPPDHAPPEPQPDVSVPKAPWWAFFVDLFRRLFT